MKITERQLEIIEAAGRILTKSGVSGLTIKNLAQEMKFSESAIYRHFPSKEKIIIAMLEYLASRMDDMFSKAMAGNLSAEEKLIAMFHNQFSFFKNNPHFVVAVFSDGLMEESQRVNQTILKIMQVKMKFLLPVILEAQQKQIFTNEISSEDLMHIIMGTFRLQMFKWRIADFKYDIIMKSESTMQALLKLIKI